MYASFDDGYGDSIVIGTPKQDLIKSKRLDDAKVLSDIKSILLENSTKLDTVIEVLGSSKKVKLDKNNKIALNRLYYSKNNLYWILCIIILLICNIYVYYYV